ncbi:ribokinase [Desulforamulus putei DSM 12395]|uniref:Ribokinase n=1 Tax=Desulforamulus putei DSM 12395 TaxID=1121429 RepID=A0A1M5CHP2_9FIRM|nr:ribokinase [Desulforamulus putei DSM 12395]
MSIVVIGSLNMDLVVNVEDFPKQGETVLASDTLFVPGGKGANQALAISLLGGQVSMIGRVGQDAFGRALKENLQKNNVDVTYTYIDERRNSGLAFISVGKNGDNRIIVSPGANSLLSPEDIEALEEVIAKAKGVVLQLEIPLATVERAVEIASKHNVKVFLDPAPAQVLSRSLLSKVDFIFPNENEAMELTGVEIYDLETAKTAAAKLLEMGCQQVLLKLGAKGVLFARENYYHHFPGFEVEVVDTTAAGDAFCAGFVLSYLEHQELAGAITYANAAGALTSTRLGAQSSLPTREEVLNLLDKCKKRVVLK